MRIEMKDGSVTSLSELAHQVESAGIRLGWVSKVGPIRTLLWSPLKAFGFDRVNSMASVLGNCATRGFEPVAFDLYRSAHRREQMRLGRSIMAGLVAESVMNAIRPYALSEEERDYLSRSGFRFGLRLLHSIQNTSEVQGLAIRVRNSIGLEAQRRAQQVA